MDKISRKRYKNALRLFYSQGAAAFLTFLMVVSAIGAMEQRYKDHDYEYVSLYGRYQFSPNSDPYWYVSECARL